MVEFTRKILKTRELSPSRHQQVPPKKNLAEKQTDLAEDVRKTFGRHRLNSPSKTLARKQVNPVQTDISRILTIDTGRKTGESQLS